MSKTNAVFCFFASCTLPLHHTIFFVINSEAMVDQLIIINSDSEIYCSVCPVEAKTDLNYPVFETADYHVIIILRVFEPITQSITYMTTAIENSYF